MGIRSLWGRLQLALMLLLGCVPLMQAQAASALLVWPIDPVIEHDQRAAALWIENQGATVALMQLRVFAWTQQDGQNHYEVQTDVLGSPPMLRVEPGKRQLVRLTRTGGPSADGERAYRVLLDEIPQPASSSAQKDKASAGLQFQMRYSIPLFVQGPGVWTKARLDKTRNNSSMSQPALSWRTVQEDGQTWLEIHNQGPVHARLSELAFGEGAQRVIVNPGLLGYVLAGQYGRWPLNVPVGEHLQARINDAVQAVPMAPASRKFTPGQALLATP